MDTQAIADELGRSRKYTSICEQTRLRVAEWAASRHPTHAEALKAAKRKLHQVYAAYIQDWDHRRAGAILDELPASPSNVQLRTICMRLLALHASTNERLGLLDWMYDAIFAITGRPSRILDVGCGFGPLALPWMNLPRDIAYDAWEIDQRMVDMLNRFFRLAYPNARAHCRDVLLQPPDTPADVAFCLKLLPCLEQQEPGCSLDLIKALPTHYIVVSYPAHSLCGRNRQMPANYAEQMSRLQSGLGARAVAINCEQELIYVIDKRPI